MTVLLSNPMTFLLGLSFAVLPSYAPFLAIAVLVSKRWELERRDLLWAGAAVILAGVMAYHGGVRGAVFGFGQVLGPWLVFRAFCQLGRDDLLRDARIPMGLGLIVGLAAVVAGGLSGIHAFRFDTAKTIAQAIEWTQPAALYGHTVLTIGALIAAIAPRANLRVAALGLAALGILASGSREAAIAWVFVSVGLLVVGNRGSRSGRMVELGMLVVMMGIAAGLGPVMGWGRIGFLVDLTPTSIAANRLQGTEIAAGDWWDPMGVRVEDRSGTIDGRDMTIYEVHKTSPEGWRRLQQVVKLEAGQVYTVGTYVRPGDPEALSGIQGWGETQTGQVGFILTGVLDHGTWRVGRSGSGQILSSSLVESANGWKRVAATFRYDGDGPLTWWLGLAPDQRDAGMASASFAGFMLVEGDELGSYVPGSATHGLGLAAARLPSWRTAWSGFLQRPLLGWGVDNFAEYYLSRTHDAQHLHDVPTHAHDFYLDQLFERGSIGLVAAILLLAGLSVDALRRRDLPFLVVLAGILLANVFDDTLLYGGVLYPLAAVAGWRAGAPFVGREGWSDSPRQTSVRISLAAADIGTAYASLWLALRVWEWLQGAPIALTALPGSMAYVVVFWPLLAWREGLYPGYGMTAAVELQKQVTAAAASVVLLALASVIVPTEVSLPPLGLLVTLAISVVLVPVGRAIMKRALMAIGLWGRSVVVLGAGDTGSRVVEAMLRVPSHGLHPIAIFDDDPQLHGYRLHGVPIEGGLAQVERYALRHHVRQAVVAIPSLPAHALRALVDRQGKTFEWLQFVPDLPGLRSEDVYATSIDGMLTLQVRNGLLSAGNRMFKRSVDLLGSLTLIGLTSPLMLATYIWVRLDSRGPAFHLSHRIGEGGRSFRCVKFRTMHQDAEARLGSLLRADPALRSEYEHFHKLEDDPRVTRAGAVLRRISLDELPQLFNVFIGQMSLVGPRPYLERELPDVGPYHDLIFRAKPGMTGHWQVAGRNEVTFAERLDMEAHYVRNWSFWWDIILLLQTPGVVLARRGAR